MPQIILNQAEIIAAVGQRVAAAVAQHVRIDMQRQARADPGTPDQVVNGRTRELIASLIEKERSIYEGQAREMGKPPAAWPKIIEGKLEKFFQENCLIEQSFVKDPAITIKDLLALKISKIGENMNIRRFTRYQLGEA